MRALVIGADGFAGRWLVDHLHASGDTVAAVVGPNFRPPLDKVDAVHQVDVRDGAALATVVTATGPEVVFYLAGVSRQGTRDDPSTAIGISVVGSLNCLLACSGVPGHTRLVYVSSGYVYRAGPQPLNEESPTQPGAVYAAAKLVAEDALLALGPDAGVDVVVARPFNHVGPGQSDAFLVPTLARQAVAAAAGGDPVVRVANATVIRDFTDVRDVAAAYRILGERGAAGSVYNVATGVGISVEDLAHEVGRAAGVDVKVVAREAVAELGEPPTVIGDPRKLESLGWSRRFDLATTLRDVVEGVSLTAR